MPESKMKLVWYACVCVWERDREEERVRERTWWNEFFQKVQKQLPFRKYVKHLQQKQYIFKVMFLSFLQQVTICYEIKI